MTTNRFFASLAIASFAVVGIASSPIASAVSSTMTVDGVDYPVCAMEDCSDQINQVGVWQNDGRSWLIVGEATYPIDQACDSDPECAYPDGFSWPVIGGGFAGRAWDDDSVDVGYTN